MSSLFVLFVIEMWLNSKTGGHSHGGPTGNILDHNSHGHAAHAVHHQRSKSEETLATHEPSSKKWENQSLDHKTDRTIYKENEMRTTMSTMPAWFVAFYEQYVRQHTELVDMLAKKENRKSVQEAEKSRTVTTVEPYSVDEEAAVDPAVYRRMSTNITLLEGGILFHSVFVGMTVSITIDGFIILLIAILFHQMFEGLGLGSRIAAVPYPKGSVKPWLLVFAFGTTAPIGQAIGLLTRNTYDPNSAFGLIIVGVFNAM